MLTISRIKCPKVVIPFALTVIVDRRIISLYRPEIHDLVALMHVEDKASLGIGVEIPFSSRSSRADSL